MRFAEILLAFSLLVSASVAVAPLYRDASSESIIHGEYLVALNEEAHIEEINLHKEIVSAMLSDDSKIIHHYQIGDDFHGYATKMTLEEATIVRSLPNVKYIEKNKVVKSGAVSCLYQTHANPIWWGLSRINYHSKTDWLASSGEYIYEPDAGNSVDVYVIDTGINTRHPDFEGRATLGYNSFGGSATDVNGHGTHVAGIIMGKVFGVAKKARAIAVKVYPASSSETDEAHIVAGIEWVVNNRDTTRPSIINFSNYVDNSPYLDDVVRATINSGIHFVGIAGNGNKDACGFSPTQVTEAIIAAASDEQDQIASFSNYGSCVDIFAPGEKIYSDTYSDDPTSYAISTVSGTSQAAPHVTGVMANILSRHPPSHFTPATLKQHIISKATSGAVSGLTGSKASTPNRLLYYDLTCTP